jgi:hypothetical protein
MINKLFDKLIEKYHNLFTWQNDVICQECGKKIGVCGVSYGHESDFDVSSKTNVQSMQS